MLSRSLLKTSALSFVLLILVQSAYAVPSCVYCGKGTKYPSCFEVEFLKKKIDSVLKGCIDIKRGKKLESEKETPSVRNQKLEIKLMKEFCEDPVNNQGTACTKFHYSRIGKE